MAILKFVPLARSVDLLELWIFLRFWNFKIFEIVEYELIILVGCAQTAAVLDESMLGRMGDRWDFIIGWLID